MKHHKGMLKKVLIVVQNSSVPEDARVWLEAQALRDAGCNVSVVCPREPGEKKFVILDEVSIWRVKIPNKLSSVLGYIIEYLISFIVITFKILSLHAVKRFDVIQVCNPPDIFFHIGWLCKLTKTSFIYDQHDLCPELVLSKFSGRHTLFYKAALWMERRTLNAATEIICTNTSYAQLAIERHNVPLEKLWIVRNGPILEDFKHVKINHKLKRGHKFMVTYGGKIAEQDGVDILIRAIREVVYRFNRRDILFAILGDGSALPAVKRLAGKLEVGNWIEFGGWVTTNELIEYMVTADVCVSPEPSNPLNDKSTFIKVTQYIAAGRPIVAFNLLETTKSAGNAGVYAKPNDFVELGRKMVELLHDPSQREKMEKEAMNRSKLLAWNASEKVYLAAYDHIFYRLERQGEYRRAHRGWDLLLELSSDRI